jgi:hypothetical protein
MEADLDAFVSRGGDVLADVVSLDGQFAMAAIDQDDQLNRLRPAEIDERIERRPRGAAGLEHVVHQDDDATVDGERDLRAPDQWLGSDLVAHQVVAIERDVERAGGDVVARNVLERAGDPPRQRDAAAAHAHERNLIDAAISFDDFVSNARQRA